MTNPVPTTQSPNTLQTSLDDLQSRAASLALVKRLSWELERRLIVEGYLWWREASQIPGFLDQVYKAENISYNETRAVNFRPLIRLVFAQSADSFLDHWAPGLRAIPYCQKTRSHGLCV